MRALQALAGRARLVKGPELADLVGSSPGFLSQAVTPLVKAGWVRSEPGPSGGYALDVALDEVSVRSVIEAVEGPTDTGRCVLAGGPCEASGPCALHVAWQRARAQLLNELDMTSVAGAAAADAGGESDAAP